MKLFRRCHFVFFPVLHLCSFMRSHPNFGFSSFLLSLLLKKSYIPFSFLNSNKYPLAKIPFSLSSSPTSHFAIPFSPLLLLNIDDIAIFSLFNLLTILQYVSQKHDFWKISNSSKYLVCFLSCQYFWGNENYHSPFNLFFQIFFSL